MANAFLYSDNGWSADHTDYFYKIAEREVVHDLIEEAAREAVLQRAAEKIAADAIQSVEVEFLQVLWRHNSTRGC